MYPTPDLKKTQKISLKLATCKQRSFVLYYWLRLIGSRHVLNELHEIKAKWSQPLSTFVTPIVLLNSIDTILTFLFCVLGKINIYTILQ